MILNHKKNSSRKNLGLSFQLNISSFHMIPSWNEPKGIKFEKSINLASLVGHRTRISRHIDNLSWSVDLSQLERELMRVRRGRNLHIQAIENIKPLWIQPAISKFFTPICITSIHTYTPNMQGRSGGSGHVGGHGDGHSGGGGGSGANSPSRDGLSGWHGGGKNRTLVGGDARPWMNNIEPLNFPRDKHNLPKGLPSYPRETSGISGEGNFLTLSMKFQP